MGRTSPWLASHTWPLDSVRRRPWIGTDSEYGWGWPEAMSQGAAHRQGGEQVTVRIKGGTAHPCLGALPGLSPSS